MGLDIGVCLGVDPRKQSEEIGEGEMQKEDKPIKGVLWT